MDTLTDTTPRTGVASLPTTDIAHSPTQSHASSSVSSRSMLLMPLPGTKSAPRIYKGDTSKLKMFLKQYERLAEIYELTEDLKCTSIGDYCTTRVKEIIDSGELGRLKSMRAFLCFPQIMSGPDDDNNIRYKFELGGGIMMGMGCKSPPNHSVHNFLVKR